MTQDQMTHISQALAATKARIEKAFAEATARLSKPECGLCYGTGVSHQANGQDDSQDIECPCQADKWNEDDEADFQNEIDRDNEENG